MTAAGTPEHRALILGEVLRRAATVPGPATYTAIFDAVLSTLGRREEDCGLEISLAVFVLLRAGLLESDDFADGASFVIRAETDLRPSHALIDFVWSDDGTTMNRAEAEP